MSREEIFAQLLNTAKDEHEVHSFLKQHPALLAKVFIPVDDKGYVLNKPGVSMGGKHEPDFILLESMSGAWIVHFVELKRTDEVLFTSTGYPDKGLKKAIRQIEDWKSHLDNPVNDLAFRQEISEIARHKDLLCPYWIPREVRCSAGFALSDPKTHMHKVWHIVIGRRKNQSEDSIHRKARLNEDRDIDVRTYDCFLDLNWSKFDG